jgi:hypothetical protein
MDGRPDVDAVRIETPVQRVPVGEHVVARRDARRILPHVFEGVHVRQRNLGSQRREGCCGERDQDRNAAETTPRADHGFLPENASSSISSRS